MEKTFKIKSLRNIRIFGDIEELGRVEVEKYSLKNGTMNVYGYAFGKRVLLTYSAMDEKAKTLTIDNLQNIELVIED